MTIDVGRYSASIELTTGSMRPPTSNEMSLSTLFFTVPER
jgi:hypothetical protein